jgi:hypothetical protein
MQNSGDKYFLRNKAYQDRRRQMDLVAAAILKLKMMDLTPANGMVECECPEGIHPFRWKAMVASAFYNQSAD